MGKSIKGKELGSAISNLILIFGEGLIKGTAL